MTYSLKMASYGEPSFIHLRESGCAYVDKTKFISTLEQCGTRFPFIVRPRRFGKSVFANMLTAYYDKATAGDFKKNFSGTWIGEHPTPLANKFLVLKFDFSGVSGTEDLVESFLSKVKRGIRDFVNRYMTNDEEFSELLKARYSSPTMAVY